MKVFGICLIVKRREEILAVENFPALSVELFLCQLSNRFPRGEVTPDISFSAPR